MYVNIVSVFEPPNRRLLLTFFDGRVQGEPNVESLLLPAVLKYVAVPAASAQAQTPYTTNSES